MKLEVSYNKIKNKFNCHFYGANKEDIGKDECINTIVHILVTYTHYILDYKEHANEIVNGAILNGEYKTEL